jgi:predicted DNA-binding transcriptional regulator YafY
MTLKIDKRDLKDLDNVSVTAYRIISIFNLLLEAPCSERDINDRLQRDIIGARALSKDTICIYMNTLRAVGCLISRPSKNNGYKYVLKSHPFNLELNDEEIDTLVTIRKYVSTLNDWKLMVNTDNLYDSIMNDLESEKKKKFALSLKACIRDIETNNQANMISLLEKYCNKKRTILISYLSPESGEKNIELTLDKLSYENGMYYLWGYNLVVEETQYIRVDRIKEIMAINIKNSKYTPKIYTLKYKLSGIQALMYTPLEEEEIIEKNEQYITIEAKTQNKFKSIQRILSFGNDCTVISPENIRKEVITKFKSMLNNYK